LNQHTQCKKYLFLIQGSKKIENEKKKVFRENSDQKGTGAVGVRTLDKVHSNKNLHT
jgi:predicted aspartyl protease